MKPGRDLGGFSLIEVMLYFSLMAFVFGMAMALFHKGFAAHRQAEACVSDVEAAIRLDRDLREDLRTGNSATVRPDGSLSVSLPGNEVRYAQAGDDVECRATPGGTRRYQGMAGWSAAREERLVRVRWKALPHGKRGEGGTPPAFETVAVLRSGSGGTP